MAPAAAVEFQHFKSTIVEKINSYFGYKAIIDLRIKQNYIPKYNRETKKMSKELSSQEKKNISDEVDQIINKNLQESLMHLGKNIAKETK